MGKSDDIDEELKETRLRVERGSSAVTEKFELLEQRMRESVDRVKQNLDPRYQFARYPWPILAGSVVVGFFLGSARRSPSAGESRSAGESPHPTQVRKQKKWAGVQDSVSGELAGLKGLAIGAVVKLIGSMVKQSMLRATEPRHPAHTARNGDEMRERRYDTAKY